MNPQPAPDQPVAKRLNSFQLLGGILTAAAGIRGKHTRGSFANASTGAILGALVIFCTIATVCGYAFIHAIRSAVAR